MARQHRFVAGEITPHLVGIAIGHRCLASLAQERTRFRVRQQEERLFRQAEDVGDAADETQRRPAPILLEVGDVTRLNVELKRQFPLCKSENLALAFQNLTEGFLLHMSYSASSAQRNFA